MASSFKLPNWIVGLLATLLGPLMAALTPQLKEGIKDFVVNLYAKAKETSSPIDDIFVRFLAALLDVDLE